MQQLYLIHKLFNSQIDIDLVSNEKIFNNKVYYIKINSSQIFNCPVEGAKVSNNQVFGTCIVKQTPVKSNTHNEVISSPPPAHTHNAVPLNLVMSSESEVIDLSMKGNIFNSVDDFQPTDDVEVREVTDDIQIRESTQDVEMTDDVQPTSDMLPTVPQNPRISEVSATTYETLSTAPPSPTQSEGTMLYDVIDLPPEMLIEDEDVKIKDDFSSVKVGRGNYFPLFLFQDIGPEKVTEVPYDINGTEV